MQEPKWLCYEYALNYIYHYPKTESELKVKLLQKWYLEEDVDNVIAFFKTKWYVDDEKFAESYLGSEVVKKGKPLYMIRKKLFLKWVKKDTLNKVCEKLSEETQEWIQNRIKKEIDNYKKKWIDWFDIIQKLMRKGYKLDDIKHTIKA